MRQEINWAELTSPLAADRATQIGFAYQVLWTSGITATYSWIVPVCVLPAINLKQVKFFFDGHGSPEALVVWAYLSDEVLNELKGNSGRALHLSEWNEGTNLCALVLSVPGRGVHALRTVLRNHERTHRRFFRFGLKRGLDVPLLMARSMPCSRPDDQEPFC